MSRSDPGAVTIRTLAGAAEAEECARLMSSTDPWLTLGRSFAASLETVRNPAREVYVAVQGDRIAGFLILNMHGPFVGYIQTVCVAPDCRGQGLGSRLVGWAEERIFRDSPNVFMCVSSFNHDARRLYERLGYKVVGELENYFVEGHGEILLRKTIGPWASIRKSPAKAEPR